MPAASPAKPEAKPKPGAAAASSASAAAAASSAAHMASDFAPLSEEEVAFCWLGLVEQGQLSVEKLQQFMMDICGERLSTMQARDLLGYMDANGDGIVGREDFRNFVSVGRLEETNPKDFMWTPKRLYREEHGTAEAVKEDSVNVGIAERASAAGFTMFDGNHVSGGRSSAEAHGGTEVRKSQLTVERYGSNGGGGAVGSTATAASADPIVIHSVLPPDAKGHEPKPPPGAKRRPAPGGRGARLSVTAAEHSDASSAAMLAPTPDGKNPHEGAAGSSSKKPSGRGLDSKVLAKIEDALEKYELDSWDKLLKYEETCKEKIFNLYASSSDGMSASDYHKMLTRWQKLARKSMPADIRPADSLAALEDVLSRDRAERGEGGEAKPAAETKPAAEAEQGGGGDADEDALLAEAKMLYQTWCNVLDGKHRPDRHQSK